MGTAACGLTAHIIFLAFNWAVSRYVLRLETGTRKAVTIMASQKTLPMSVAVIDFLPDDFAAKGLLVLACIVTHFAQIITDAILAAKWARVGLVPAQEDKVGGLPLPLEPTDAEEPLGLQEEIKALSGAWVAAALFSDCRSRPAARCKQMWRLARAEGRGEHVTNIFCAVCATNAANA